MMGIFWILLNIIELCSGMQWMQLNLLRPGRETITGKGLEENSSIPVQIQDLPAWIGQTKGQTYEIMVLKTLDMRKEKTTIPWKMQNKVNQSTIGNLGITNGNWLEKGFRKPCSGIGALLESKPTPMYQNDGPLWPQAKWSVYPWVLYW